MTVQIDHFKTQVKWEPWKVVAVSMGAGAAIMAAAVTIAATVFRIFGHS